MKLTSRQITRWESYQRRILDRMCRRAVAIASPPSARERLEAYNAALGSIFPLVAEGGVK